MAIRTILYWVQGGGLAEGHVIEYEEKLWLVPSWLEGPSAGTRCPARIICLDGLPLSAGEPPYSVDVVLSTPLHKDIVEGRRVSQAPLVIERPEITLRVGTDFRQ
jgi:hypothetical protein